MNLRIKKLDIFILKSFLMLFAGTFFICLFIFMMQFLWRYVDELVGKGLEVGILAQFFFYSALTLIPLSLPLAILLAALMTFGNFGERYELLSMKAAGIPLLRIMRPLIILCVFISGMSFYFQNVVAPKAQMKLWTLLVSMKQTSPELDIPEGVFYSEISGYNIYVKKKDRDTGVMQDLLIYNFSDGFENARVIWASEGKMEMTSDKKHLYLHLYNGEQFENLKSQTISSKNVPYRRETFREKHIIIEFDGGFSMVDGGFLSERSDSKNMTEISHSIDSLSFRADSIGRSMFNEIKLSIYSPQSLSKTDSIKVVKKELPSIINGDSVFNTYTLAEKEEALANAYNQTNKLASDWGVKSIQVTDTDKNILRHKTDWHKKITLSLSCLMFFFIGAPLGAIIRKGGIGLPVVISVVIFVLYYIIDSGSTRVARSGEMNIVLGVWMSTLVLMPIGIFFTYKSNKDSVVFNAELYLGVFKWLLGMRPSRHLIKKEVIIEDPNYRQIYQITNDLSAQCNQYLQQHRLTTAPNYFKIFNSHGADNQIADISKTLEAMIEELSNSKDRIILKSLNNYPILSTEAHKRPFDRYWLNILTGILIPVGLFFYFRIWFFRLRLEKDLKKITQTNNTIQEQIKKQSLDI
ncbi:MAG: LptF/LptG family permease [Bacteroidaceae bacterium]|nr:LptF/LptG family permease [Bacteroidaceae bacterium]